MSQTSSPSKIALLESAASLVNANFVSGPPWNAGRESWAYMGMARILLDSGLTYDSVFLPDSSYSMLSSASAADLAKYSAVVAGIIWTLDDTQLNALLDFTRQTADAGDEGRLRHPSSQPTTGQPAAVAGSAFFPTNFLRRRDDLVPTRTTV